MSSRGIKPPQPTKKWWVGQTAVKVMTPGTFLLCDAGASGEHFQDPPEKSGSQCVLPVLSSSWSLPTVGSSSPPIDGSSSPPTDGLSSPPTDGSSSPPTYGSRSPPTDGSSSPTTLDGSSSPPPDGSSSSNVNKNRPSVYNTKSKNVQKKKEEMSKRVSNFDQAISAFQAGEFSSIRKCAKHFQVSRPTLQRLLKQNQTFVGTGRKCQVFTSEEETKIINFIVHQQEIGCGLTWYQLQLLLQEVMQSLKTANISRSTGYEEHNNLPNMSFVRRFGTRHSLTLYKSLEISKGRAICSVADLENWQADTRKYLLESDKFAECFSDPRRIWNQDESSIECGISGQKVLAPIGSKVIYTVAGSTREHVTTSFIASASGLMVPPRTIHKGQRVMATQHLQNLPKDGKSGEWTFSVADKGFINRDLFLQVLIDFDHYLTLNDIPRPVILFLDGASPHISLSAAEFCTTHNIQCWLFKPNFTHLLQPLDLSFFASLKRELKKLAWSWQTNPTNTGQALSKYSVIGVLHSAVENCLNKENCVESGFKRAGLFPWNPNAPDRSTLNPSKVYAVPVSAPDIQSPPQEADTITVTAVDGSSSPLSRSLLPGTSWSPPPGTSWSPPTVASSSSQPGSSSNPSSVAPSSPTHGEDIFAADIFLDVSEDSPSPNEEFGHLVDITNFDPPLSSTQIFDEQSQTYLCPMCQRRILNRFQQIHVKNCNMSHPSPELSVPLVPPFELPSVPDGQENSSPKLPTRLPTFSIEDSKNSFDEI